MLRIAQFNAVYVPRCFDGILDDVRVYSRTLSAAEAAVIHNAAR